jgi:L-fucose isomerase-like protein
MGAVRLPKIRAGFVGFGEVNTPREIIERKCARAARLLVRGGIELVRTAPVSDDPAGADAARACRELAGADFDLLVLCVAGWIPAHAVVAVADRFRHKPMLLWGLSGWRERGRWVSTADQAGTTALRGTLVELGCRFKYVFDRLGAAPDAEAILDFARAAGAAERLRGARIGMMGWRDMNLYATGADATALRAAVGPEVECFEMLEMTRRAAELDPARVRGAIRDMRRRWKFRKPAPEAALRQAAELYLAVSDKARERGYQAVSLKDVDGVKKLLGFPPAPVFQLLADADGLCTIPENDALGAATQLMVRGVTGQAAAYLEFYEFLPGGVLMGAPDYVPAEVVDGRVTVMPTEFGSLGKGLLNTSKVRAGRVTLCRLGCSGGRFRLHLVAGTAKRPRRWEEAGWAPPAPQLPSLEIALDSPLEEFAGRVLGQHYIISYGDNRRALADLCGLLGVEVV